MSPYTVPFAIALLDFVVNFQYIRGGIEADISNEFWCDRWYKTMNNLSINKKTIAQFCRKNHIKKLSLFGSVLREDFGPESDIDVLVEFESGHVPGLSFFDMEAELSQLLDRKVELHTPQFLSHYFRDDVLAEAEIQYDKTG